MKPWTKPPRLKVGELVKIQPGGPVHKVLRVGEGSALIRPGVGEHREFEAKDGKLVAFDAPGRAFQVSPHAFVYRPGDPGWEGA